MKKNRIKVLFTIPNFDTAGSGKALLKIAKGLNKELFDVQIACFHSRGIFFEKVKESGLKVHLINYVSPARPIFGCLYNCWKTSLFFKQFDIVHSYNYSADYTEGLSVRMAGRKYVFTKKNMNWGGQSARAWKLRSLFANRIAVQNTDMIKEFYPNSDKTYYLTRGVDTKEFHPETKDVELRSELNLDQKTKVVLCVANLVPVKGVEVLLQAFSMMKESDIRLIIVGDADNEYGRFLKHLSSELSIGEKVQFTGKRIDVNRFLSIADVFVLPTLNKGRKEGSPVSLLEAMASGVVVLASSIAGIKDQLANFPSLMFEAGNVNELYDKLEFVFNLDESDRKKLVDDLVHEVAEKFTIEQEIQRHEQLYLSLMK